MTTLSSSQSLRSCPTCTYDNRINAKFCSICTTKFISLTIPSLPDDPDIEILDTNKAKKTKQTNLNNSYNTTYNNNNNEQQPLSDDDQIKHIMEESRKSYQEQQRLILEKIKLGSKPDTNINNNDDHHNIPDTTNHNNTANALYDPKFDNLFSNYSTSNNRLMVDIEEEIKENIHSTDDDMKENNINHRKRILSPPIIQSSVSSPPTSKRRKLNNNTNNARNSTKKQKDIEEDIKDDGNLISIEQKEEEEEDIDIDIDNHSIPEPQRKLIERGYIKFLNSFINGEFCLDTVMIEFGPEFKGSRKVFNKLKIPFSDHADDNDDNGEMVKDEFKTMDNPDLPAYVARIKHIKLQQPFSKSQIYRDADKVEEVEKLNELTMEGLAQYFLPRLLSEQECVHEGYTIIRLTYKTFVSIWDTERWNEEKYESFDHMIQSIRDIITDPNGLNQPIGTILVLLEDVKQTVNRIKEQEQRGETMDDPFCPFHNEQHLKSKLMEYALFRDKNIHIELVSKDRSAEYIERAAYSLAMDRFERMRVSALTRRPRKSKSRHRMIEIFDEIPSNKTVFKDMLSTISGVSAQTITAITDKYPTFASLRRKYKTSNNPKLLLQGISRVYGDKRKRIGATLSTKIYQQLTGEYADD